MSKIEKRKQALRDKRNGYLFLIIAIVAILPFTYSGRQYNVTFIPFHYLIIGSLIAGLAVHFILNKTIKRIENIKFFELRYYLLGSIICGSYISSVFFLSNIYLSKSKLYSIETPIIAKLETRRYHHVFIRVNIDGFEKDIPIPNKEIPEIDNYKSIVLTLDSGFWNFPFIVEKTLKK